MMSDTSFRSLFKNKRFASLFIAQTVSLIGSGMTTIALGLLAYNIAGRSAAEVLGTALTLRILAYVIFAPIAGVIADRIPRKILLLSMDAVRFCIIGLMPFVTEVWQIYTLIFVLNLASAFHTPIYQSILPDIIPEDDKYQSALSLSRVAYDLQNLLSPLLASLIIGLIGFKIIFMVDALTFIASFLIVVFVAIPLPVASKESKKLRDLIPQSLYGSKILIKNHKTRFLLILNVAVALAGAVAIVDTTLYVKDILHEPDKYVGYVMAALGIGSLLAAYLIPKLLTFIKREVLMLGGAVLLAASLLPVFFVPATAMLCVLWFINGFGESLISVAGGVYLKEASQKHDRARIYAAYFSLSHAAWLLSYPLAGWLGSFMGLTNAIAMIGVLTVIFAIISILAIKRPI